jgi:tripartite-type tricarboxylate transporter receptor subunit TctC
VVLGEPADGNTLLFVSSAYAVLPSSGLKLPYDPVKDLQAVSIVARSATVLVASTQSGFKTTADLIAAAKAKPGSLNFASSGLGSGTHLNAEYLASAAGFTAEHIPLKGGRDMLTEVISGRVQYAFLPASDLKGFGPDQLTRLGVSSKERVKLSPEVPPIADSGLPGFEYFLWQALLLRSNTPAPAVERMGKAIAHALADPAVQKGFQELGIDPVNLDVNGSRHFITDETNKTTELVKSRGLKLS